MWPPPHVAAMLRAGDGADEKTVLFALTIGVLVGLIFLFGSGAPGMGPVSTLVTTVVTFGLVGSGAYAFLAMRNMSRIPLRRFLKAALYLCLVLAVPLGIILVSQSVTAEMAANGPMAWLVASLVIYPIAVLIMAFIATLLICEVFGGLALLMIVLRRLTPWGMTFLRTVGGRSWLVRKLTLWAYNVPYSLEPAELHARPEVSGFSKQAFLNSLLLVVILDTAFAVYLCLNPMFLQAMPVQELFSLVSLLSLLVPLLVVWIEAYSAMGMRIPGRREDLMIARNLRARALATLVPIGTLLIMIRVAFQTVDMSLFGTFFIAYMLSNIVFGAAILLAFYHWFWNDAARIPDR
jgi:hypothetical protein